jgi:TRAP-type transport system periplasmic protein
MDGSSDSKTYHAAPKVAFVSPGAHCTGAGNHTKFVNQTPAGSLASNRAPWMNAGYGSCREDHMCCFEARTLARTAAAAGALAFAIALPLRTAQAQQQTYPMRISTPTIHDIPNTWIEGYMAMLEKDSGGRIKPKEYPASQLGTIPRQIEGTQFGSIQCVQIPPEFMVGLDPRFQVLAAPGLVDSIPQGQRLTADPAVRKLMLGLGATKGLHGISVWYATPNVLISRTPLRTLADFKGKKVRVFASPFQTVAFERLGITPVAMSLGDVLPALQQGAIDGAITGIGPIVKFHMLDAAKYVTAIDQPGIFIMAEINQKWYESLPKDLQHVIDSDAAKEDAAIAPAAIKLTNQYLQEWTSTGGTLLRLSPEEHDKMMEILANVGTDVSSKNPTLASAYKLVTEAAKRAAGAAK